ncbi:MAG: hypothetical protein HQK53_04830 [Oligoflexia bacterium]|nr:hypothetical protein [Oligoflexia bacterium]
MAEEEAGDGQIKVVLPSLEYPPIECSKYGKGCIYGITVSAWNMIMLAILFDNEENARRAATRFDAYYKYNWMFDEIQNEPYLQDFVIKTYGAERPRENPPPFVLPQAPTVRSKARPVLQEKETHEPKT